MEVRDEATRRDLWRFPGCAAGQPAGLGVLLGVDRHVRTSTGALSRCKTAGGSARCRFVVAYDAGREDCAAGQCLGRPDILQLPPKTGGGGEGEFSAGSRSGDEQEWPRGILAPQRL